MKLQAGVSGRGGRCSAMVLLCPVLCVGLVAGCADMEHMGWYLASTTKPALMQMAGQRLEGTVQMRPDRTGAVVLAGEGRIAACAGALRFTAVNAGVMDMRCSDGAMFDMRFTLVNEVKGYAYGTFQDATVALTFGMDDLQAQAYLAQASTPAAAGSAGTSSVTP